VALHASQVSNRIVGSKVNVMPPVIVMVAEAVLVESVTDAAVRVTIAGSGVLNGAENVVLAPLAVLVGLRVPQAAAEQPAPERVHVTPLFWESF
jgi:hypothetical protein